MIPPTSEIRHHHKVTNITMSPTSLSPIRHLKAKLKALRKQRSSNKNFTTNFYLFHFSYNEGINLTKDSESMENSVSMDGETENSKSMNWETKNSHQKSQSMSFRWILQGFTES